MITNEDIVRYVEQIIKKNLFLCKEYETMLCKVKDKRARKILKNVYHDKVWHKEALQELILLLKERERERKGINHNGRTAQ